MLDKQQNPYINKNYKLIFSKITEYIHATCDKLQIKNGIIQSGKQQVIKLVSKSLRI